MRIISGKFKGRKIDPPLTLPVRPTTDFAKTGLFNIIENRIDLENTVCLDLFSGTGSISLELVSRGCKNIISVDKELSCINFLKAAAQKLEVNNLSTYRSDALLYLKKTASTFDLIFADPPFNIPVREQIHDLVMSLQVLKPGGIFILEHASRENFDHLTGFDFSRNYGNVSFSFFIKLDL